MRSLLRFKPPAPRAVGDTRWPIFSGRMVACQKFDLPNRFISNLPHVGANLTIPGQFLPGMRWQFDTLHHCRKISFAQTQVRS
jgi:hypothetical protein